MLEFKPLKLSSKQEIDSCAKNMQVTSSELNFTTFYIYRNLLNVKYCILDNCVIYKTKHGNNKASYRFPIGGGDKKEIIETLINEDKDLVFYGMTSDMVEFLSVNFKDRFKISKMSNYTDYVYTREKLSTLAGKKLHSKRNHINSFYKLYSSEFSKITGADKDLIVNTYNSWFCDTDDEYLIQEKDSIADLLTNFEELGLLGGKLTVSDNLVAFTIGERLNDQTAVVHIEKANTDYKGAYTVINQQFAEKMLGEFLYVNREEDMGLPGLRKAKMSYLPDLMIEKYKGELV